MEFTTQNSLILIITFLDFILGALVFLQNKKDPVNITFGVMTFLIGLWSLGAFFFRALPFNIESITVGYVLYILASLLPISCLAVTLAFPPYSLLSRKLAALLILENFALILSITSSDFIISGINLRGSEKILVWGPYYWVYVLHFTVIFSVCYLVLLKKITESAGLVKIHLKYIFWGTLLPALGAMFTNLLLPWFGIYRYYTWAGQVLMVLLALIVGYAVAKHHLFNLKVIATEILTFTIWFALLIRALGGGASGRSFDTAIFAAAIFAGIFLIRSVMREVEQREKMENLTKQLAAANEQLKQLDEAKSEFISIASHQLRAPMTVIRGYISMILERSMGEINEKVRDALSKVEIAGNQLIKLISDLLDLSRIESGKIRYDYQSNDLVKVVEEVVREFKPSADKKGVGFEFQNKVGEALDFSFDKDKLREVVLNLIDNAIKYSKAGGHVRVVLEKTGDRVRYSVKDDGMGVSPEDRKKLFSKFARADTAQVIDPGGMGIGLYFVKRVVEDHGGTVGVESEGVGKGSTFWVELPLR